MCSSIPTLKAQFANWFITDFVTKIVPTYVEEYKHIAEQVKRFGFTLRPLSYANIAMLWLNENDYDRLHCVGQFQLRLMFSKMVKQHANLFPRIGMIQ